MLCQRCDSDNSVDSRFCAACGFRLEVKCARCDHLNSFAAEFCSWCGATLRVVSGGPKTGGERKHATILFADIVGSTHLIANLDAEDALNRLRPVVAAMAQAVRRFDGIVVRSLGDGLKAAFGAPRALEGHALLACKAALAMQEAVAALPSAPSIRIGLHSGEVVAGELDTGSAVEQEAVGLTVHLANRMEQLAEAGSICISGASFQLVRGFCDTVDLGMCSVKGIDAPVEVHRLVGLKPAVAGEQFRGTRLTRFLGRANELANLKDALTAAERGECGVIGISAAPGLGKSRLCYEFSEWCRRQNVEVVEARVSIYAQATPMQAVLDMMRSFLRLSSLEKAEAARDKIAERLLQLDQEFEDELPLLNEFLGVADPERPFIPLGPHARHARLRSVMARMVKALGRNPLVIIIEDLHWLDNASEDFIETLVDAVQGTRALLLLNFRTAYQAGWMTHSYYRELPLAELGASDIQDVVADLIGSTAELRNIGEQVADRSGGNPFFAEELVQSLAERGVVVGRRGAFRRGHAAVMEALPGTVQAVIGARIDGLAQRERHVLQVGSIIGKEFRASILQEVAAQEPYILATTLGRLCEAGLLQRSDNLDDRAYRFGHPLIREVAYTTQLRSRRSLLHSAVAQAIERFHADRADEYAALVAYHLEEAGERSRAAVYAARAARWIGQMSSEQAIGLWHKVRMLLADAPRSRADDALRIEANGQIAWLGWREGLTTGQARPFVQEALNLAREIDDSIIPLLLLVDGRIAQVSGGNSDAFVHQIKQAIALAEGNRDAGRLATLYAALSHAYGWAGLLREALEASDAALVRVAEVTDFDQRFLGYSVENWILGLRGRILLRLGQFDAARSCFDKLIGIKTLIDPTVLFIAHFGYVDMAWCHDDPTMAQEHAARIAALAERHGGAYLRLYQLTSKAMADAIAGNYEDAVNGAMRSVEYLRQTGAAVEFEPELLANLAEYRMRQGDYAQAVATALDAIAMGRQRGARLPVCRATITLASLVLLTEGPGAYGRAASLLAEAERLLKETGTRIYDARAREARTLLAEFSRNGVVAPAD